MTTTNLDNATLYIVIQNYPAWDGEMWMQGFRSNDVAGITERLRLLETSSDPEVRTAVADPRTRIEGDRWNGTGSDYINLSVDEFRAIAN